MRIGILGAGKMAGALGTQWAGAGHEIMIGARDQSKAQALVDRVGAARAGTLAEAAQFGEVVLVAVEQHAVLEVVKAAGGERGALRGRVVVDCTVPFVPGAFTLTTAGGPSVVERIAAAAAGARVVKAFNICAAEVYRMTPPVFDGNPLAVPVCGDDPAAVETVSMLARDMGCTPIAAGGLERAALLEATSVFVVGLWFGGADAAAAIPPLKYAFGA